MIFRVPLKGNHSIILPISLINLDFHFKAMLFIILSEISHAINGKQIFLAQIKQLSEVKHPLIALSSFFFKKVYFSPNFSFF